MDPAELEDFLSYWKQAREFARGVTAPMPPGYPETDRAALRAPWISDVLKNAPAKAADLFAQGIRFPRDGERYAWDVDLKKLAPHTPNAVADRASAVGDLGMWLAYIMMQQAKEQGMPIMGDPVSRS